MARRQSFDTLSKLPRVPHVVGSVQQGAGGLPPDRLYVDYGEPVDIAVAAANCKSRQKGEKELIPGGLDDEDPRMYHKMPSTSPYEKMQVAQTRALSREDVERLKSAPAGETGSSGPRPAEVVSGDASGSSFLSTGGGDDKEGTQGGALLSIDMGGPAGSLPQASSAQIVYVDRPVEKIVEKPVDSPASKWLKNRVRVEIATRETTFSVSAIAVIRSIHAVTVILPTTNDAMTFIPATGASIKVHPAGGDVFDTIFTGASFDIPDLGILGLAFLIPNKEPD